MFYKTLHDLTWKLFVTYIRVTFEVIWNWKLSRYGAVLLSFLKRNDQKKPSATVQIVCSLQFKMCTCILSLLFVCVCLPLEMLHHSYFDAHPRCKASDLSCCFNGNIQCFSPFELAFFLWKYIISFCSKFLKLFHGSYLGNSKFYLI